MKNKKSVREVFLSEEISLGDLYRLFIERKKYVIISLAVFFCMGVLIAVTSPYEYESEAQMLSEDINSGESSLGGLAGLAGLAGISLPDRDGGGSAGLSPGMYPSIAASEPFLLELMQERFYFQEKGNEMSLYEYFTEERPGHIFVKIFGFFRGLPGRFFALFEKEKAWVIPVDTAGSEEAGIQGTKMRSRIINISHYEQYVATELSSRLTIEAEGRIITVKVKMPEPYVSAELNNIVFEKVLDYVIAYKTDKQKKNLEFVEQRTTEAEERFKQAQFNLAAFRDTHQGIVTQTGKTKEEQLQAERDLIFNIYNGLAQQLEQAKIQLKKETPLFTEFEPVSVPLTRAEPSIPKILALYTAVGVFLGGMIVFVSIVTAYFKESATAS